MIVEFVGCTGAGKTTLAREVAARLPGSAVMGSDLVLDHPVVRHLTSPTAANLMEELAGLPYVLADWHANAPVLALSARLLHDHAPTRFDEVMNARSVVRRMGALDLARRRARGRTVLLDEGPVLIAYHLFVYSSADIDGPDLDRFADLVPLPDRIVHVKADLATLVERALDRPDRRRQLARVPRPAVAAALRRAADVFDRLTSHPRVRDRVLVLDNTAAGRASRERVVDRIVESLLETGPAPSLLRPAG